MIVRGGVYRGGGGGGGGGGAVEGKYSRTMSFTGFYWFGAVLIFKSLVRRTRTFQLRVLPHLLHVNPNLLYNIINPPRQTH